MLGRLIRVKCAQDNVTLLFFPDFSPATTIRRKSFNPVLKMTSLGSPAHPHLSGGGVIKLRHKGEQRMFDSPQKAEDFISSCHRRQHILWLHKATGEEWRPPSFRPGGRGLMAGMEAIPAAREKMVAGWTWIPVESLLFLFPLSSWDVILFVRCNCLFTGETNCPLFFSRRGLVESGLDCSV